MPSLVSGRADRLKSADATCHKKKLKKALPLADGITRHRKKLMREDKVAVAEKLVFFYANTTNKDAKRKVSSILSKWLASGELRTIPPLLAESIWDKNGEYAKLFFHLAMSAPDEFAKKIMELLNYGTGNTEHLLNLSKLLRSLVKTKGACISQKSFSENISITIAYMINAKDILFNRENRSEEDREKLRDAYARSLIISELLPFIRMTEENSRLVLLFLDILVEMKYFRPAANTVLNAGFSKKEKIDLAIRLHNHLSFVKKHIPSLSGEIEGVDKMLLDFLKDNKVFPLE